MYVDHEKERCPPEIWLARQGDGRKWRKDSEKSGKMVSEGDLATNKS
jgi:hypothetical protein